MVAFILVLVFLAALSQARNLKTCSVTAIGGGQDDGPNINAAFENCSTNSIIMLDGYYVVDTLLFTTGLRNVDIVLSGTCERFYH